MQKTTRPRAARHVPTIINMKYKTVFKRYRICRYENCMVWFVDLVCVFGLWVWFVGLVCGFGLWVWFVGLVCEFGLWVWFVSHEFGSSGMRRLLRELMP